MHRVFVYGTLKQGEPNYNVLVDKKNGQSRFLGDAQTVSKLPLVIATKFNIPFLINCPGKGDYIVGEVYEVDDRMLKMLDDFEGHPEYYQREKIALKWVDNESTEERLVTCWAYMLNKYKPFVLDLPYISKYISSGGHNQPYVPSEELEDMIEILR